MSKFYNKRPVAENTQTYKHAHNLKYSAFRNPPRPSLKGRGIPYSALLLGAFFLLAFRLSAQEKAIIDGVVATVGGEVILLSDVEQQFSYLKQQQGGKIPDEARCEIVQNLIIQKLLVNQAKIDSVEVKDDEVETQIGARVDRLLTYFNQDQKALEEYYGQTIDQIRETTRFDMRNQMLAERMQGQITSKATVTPAEVKQFFLTIPADSLPYFNSEVEIREIVYKPKVNAVERQKALDRTSELLKRIKEGADFAELAKRFSDDPGSGEQGGDLGWQKRGTFVPEFEAAAYNLEKDQLSDVVESEFGFHIIQLLERRGNLIHTRHILIKPEITDDDLERAQAKLDSVRLSIRNNEMTFTEAVKRFGDKNQQSFHNDGRVANPRSGNTFFEITDLDPGDFFAVDTLKVGQVSAPLSFKSNDGSRLFKILQLQSRTKPHQADLKQDYGKIQTAALEQKKSTYTEKWVLEKLATTYMSVHQMFQTCPNIQEMLTASGQNTKGK